MREILLVVFAFLVTWVALAVLGMVVLRWRLGRANRVSPAVKSPAPLHWLWHPGRAARLHRRLRAAVAMIHLSPSPRSREAPSLSVDELRRELEYQAVELDQHLVIAVRHPRSHRRGLLASLDVQVVEVERLAVRLSNMSRPTGHAVVGLGRSGHAARDARAHEPAARPARRRPDRAGRDRAGQRPGRHRRAARRDPGAGGRHAAAAAGTRSRCETRRTGRVPRP